MPGPIFRYNGAVLPNAFGRVMPPDDEWLASQPDEEALLPDLPIVDAHHHLWNHPGFRYLVPEFAADVRTGHRVVATVFVEGHSLYRADGPAELKPVGETESITEQSAQSAGGQDDAPKIAAGIIGHADVSLGSAVRPVLDAHVAAGDGRCKGIRVLSHWDADAAMGSGQSGADRPRVLVERDVQAAFAVLADMSLVLETYVFFTQLADVAETADALPGLTVVINHCGGPLGYGPYGERQAEHYAAWRAAICDVARRPNVVCKLGGILNRTATFDYLHADRPPTSEELATHWRQWIEPCIEAFGADRCMFESNYPVEKMGVGYAALWNTFKRIAGDASGAERTALFSGTAARVYSLAL